ncbi:MAG: hypothetical protein MUO62_11710 [Anaerolineales bacterium]|nr:hypothetical protein [Anaerolineales bacterium]
MVSDSERTKILEMIEAGTITAEEGLTLLNVLNASDLSEIDAQVDADLEFAAGNDPEMETLETQDGGSNVPPDRQEEPFPSPEHAQNEAGEAMFAGEVEVMAPSPAYPDEDEIQRWKRWWIIPLWIGAGVTVVGGVLMYWGLNVRESGFWFACAWFPFLLGVALLALAWNSRTTPWLHVRIHQAPGEKPQKIAISFPIPVQLTVWGLRVFGRHIPYLENTSLDEVILALKTVTREGTPLFVDVEEGENGERVQVFIG